MKRLFNIVCFLSKCDFNTLFPTIFQTETELCVKVYYVVDGYVNKYKNFLHVMSDM